MSGPLDSLSTRAAKTRLREAVARVAAALDVSLFDTAPKFLGPPVRIEPLARESSRR